VYAVGPGALDHIQYRLGVEVALGRGPAPEGVGLVGHADVQRRAIQF